jgi:hypothetical protein
MRLNHQVQFPFSPSFLKIIPLNLPCLSLGPCLVSLLIFLFNFFFVGNGKKESYLFWCESESKVQIIKIIKGPLPVFVSFQGSTKEKLLNHNRLWPDTKPNL